MKNLNKEESDRFFREVHEVLEKRDGLIISFMHTCIGDETTPHLHAGVTLFLNDKKREIQMLFSKSLHETGLSDLHKHLSDHGAGIWV